MTYDETIAESERLLASANVANIPVSLVQRLQALHAVRQLQVDLEDHKRSQRRLLEATTIPEGYELTHSGSLIGFRKIGRRRTVDWSNTLRGALRKAWAHFEAPIPDAVEEAVVETNEMELRAPSPAHQRAMIDAAVRVANVGVLELDSLIKAIDLPSRMEAMLIVDHLVLLGYIEEVAPTPAAPVTSAEDTSACGRFFRWMKEER